MVGFVATLLALALLSGTALGAGSPTITFSSGPGTGPAPATLGPYTLTPFTPVGSNQTVSSVTGPTGQVGVSPSMFDDAFPFTNGTTNFLVSNGAVNQFTLTMPPGTGAFYLYAGWECNCGGGPPPTAETLTATAQEGTSSGPISVALGHPGYFGFYATGGACLQTVQVNVSGSPWTLTAGAFGIATVPAGTTCTNPGGKRSSGTQVTCNYIVATGTDTCTATVGDSAAPPRSTPTGAVKFVSQSGGVFTVGNTCSLVPTPLSPGVASCSVQYLPPSSAFPNITATYAGDSQHATSSASTSFLTLGGPVNYDNGPAALPTGQSCSAGPALDRARVAAGAEQVINKVCAFLGSGVSATCAIAFATGALGSAAQPEISPGALAGIAFVCGVTTAYLLHLVTDPVDVHYRQLALVSTPVGTKLRQQRQCGRLTGARCRQLLGAANAYLKAVNDVSRYAAVLYTTGNRLVTAKKAHVQDAVGLQTAADKLYSGKLAAADVVAHSSGVRLGRLLKRDHSNVTLSRGQLQNGLSQLERHPPSGLASVLRGLGIKKAFYAALRSKIRKLPASISLASVFAASFASGGLVREYRSTVLENLRALVRGLAKTMIIKPLAANALLADLACTSVHTAPVVSKFSKDVGALVSRRYAGLLQFAARPLLHLKRC